MFHHHYHGGVVEDLGSGFKCALSPATYASLGTLFNLSQVTGASLRLGGPVGASQNYENQSDGEVNKCQILHVINTPIDLKTSTGLSQRPLPLLLPERSSPPLPASGMQQVHNNDSGLSHHHHPGSYNHQTLIQCQALL